MNTQSRKSRFAMEQLEARQLLSGLSPTRDPELALIIVVCNTPQAPANSSLGLHSAAAEVAPARPQGLASSPLG